MQNQLTTRAFDDEVDAKYLTGYKTCDHRRERAEAAAAAGDVEEAIRLYHLNLAWCEKTLPPLHLLTVMHQDKLAEHYTSLGQFDKAVDFYWDRYQARDKLDTDSEETIGALKWYAWALLQAKKEDMAAGFFGILLRKQEKSPLFGKTHPDTLSTMSDMASCLYRLWKQDKSKTEKLQKAAEVHEDLVEKTKGQPSLALVNNRLDLAKDYVALGRYGEATSLLKENSQSISTWQKRGLLDKDEAHKAEVSNSRCWSMLTRATRKVEDARKDVRGKPRSGSVDRPRSESAGEGRRTAKNAYLSRDDIIERPATATLRSPFSDDFIERPATATLRSPFSGLYFESETPEDSDPDGHAASSRGRLSPRERKKTPTSERASAEGVSSQNMPKDENSKPRKAIGVDRNDGRLEAKSQGTEGKHTVPRKRPKIPVIIIPTTEDVAHGSKRKAPSNPETARTSGRSRSTEADTGDSHNAIDSLDSGPETIKSRRPRSSSDSRLDPQRGAAAAPSPRFISDSTRCRSRRKSSPATKNEEGSSKSQADIDRPGKESSDKNQVDNDRPEKKGESSKSQVDVDRPGKENSNKNQVDNDRPEKESLNKNQVDPDLPDKKEKPVDGLPQDQSSKRPPKSEVLPGGTLLQGRFGFLRDDKLQDEDYEVRDWFQRIAEINDLILGPLRKNRERRVKIAVLDSGVKMSNQKIQAFKERIKKRKDFVDAEGDASDAHGHGTYCVGLIHRVAPEADIYVGKIVHNSQSINKDVAAMAIEKALSSERGCWNVDILSLSFGFPYREESIEQMLEKYDRGKIILAAASNDGSRRRMTYPASRPGVIAVNSATADGSISTYNPLLNGENNLSILGEKVQSAWAHNTTKIMSGTSVATPIAAGIAALLIEIAIKQNDTFGDQASKVLEKTVKSYGGMSILLRSMSSPEKKDDKYFNILPWELLAVDEHILDPEQTLLSVAVYEMRKVLNSANLLPRI